ncbi:MAG: hypothetical protein AB1689_24685 [Thermodesulfobacteriota bacterium]
MPRSLRAPAIPLLAFAGLALTAAGAAGEPSPAATLEFERSYTLAVGDKGEDRFELPEHRPSCTSPGLAFEFAEIVYVRRRFGDAQIVATPAPGCVRCGPIVVRRYHEPTGELRYRLRVHRRTVPPACDGAG